MQERVFRSLSSVRRGVLLLVTFGVPIAFLPTTLNDPFDHPKLALLIAGVAVALTIRIAEIILGGDRLRIRPMAIPVAALLLPLSISWLASDQQSWALWGQYSRWQGLIPYAAVAVLGILIADGFRDRRLSIAWALALSGAVVGAYSFAQSFGLDPFFLPDAVALNGSTMGNPNFTGAFLAITLPVGVYLWLKAPRGRLLAVPGCILSAVSLILLGSQGGWVAAIVGLCALAGGIASQRWNRARIVGLAVAALVVIAVVSSVAAAAIFGSPGAGPIIGGTVRDRAVEWMTAGKMAADSPVIGHGPNAYALLGTRYRSTENALSSELWKADDPHSLPFAFLANSGLMGLLGIAGIYVWAVRRTLAEPGASLKFAFGASAVAYITQSLVSIDEIGLRTSFWVVLAGLAAVQSAPLQVRHPRLSPPRLVAAGAAIVVGCAVTVWSVGFVRADARVHHGINLFAEGAVDSARSEFKKALAFRNEYRYREIYSEELGVAGLNLGDAGAPLIAEMRRVDSYLATFPETIGLRKSARILHYWSHFDLESDKVALDRIRRARAMDPNNPAISVLESEILIDLERAQEAVVLLERYEQELSGLYPDYWSNYALALALSGDHEKAAEVYEQASALAPGGCRSTITGEVLKQVAAPQPVPPPQEYENFRHMVCDPGFFQFAVDQMPAEAQDFYR